MAVVQLRRRQNQPSRAGFMGAICGLLIVALHIVRTAFIIGQQAPATKTVTLGPFELAQLQVPASGTEAASIHLLHGSVVFIALCGAAIMVAARWWHKPSVLDSTS